MPQPAARLSRPAHKRHAAAGRFRRALGHLSPATWATVDLAVVTLATAFVYQVRLAGDVAGWIANPWLAAAAFCACITGSGVVFGLYDRQTLLARSRVLVRSGVALGVGVALAYALLSVVLHANTSRWLGLAVSLSFLAVAVPLRVVAHELITTSRTNLLCVGTGESVRKLVALLAGHPHYRVVGHVRTSRSPAAGTEDPFIGVRQRVAAARSAVDFERLCPQLGSADDICEVLNGQPIDEIVVDAALTSEPAVGAVVLAALDKRCRVTDQPTFVEKLMGEVPTEDITAQWFLLADVHPSESYEMVKRLLDILASLVGLALTLPFWPLIALAVRLDSRGTVLFRQARVGVHGRVFQMIKFRTMRNGAERNGAQWAQPNDRRVTRIGRLLRKSRLDELPQLWNILRGDMALVGPRPERPEFVEQLAQQIPHYRQRHLIKPGLSGWAQIHYGYGATVDDARRKLCFDLYYLKHRSIDMDVGILIRTLGTFALGAR